MEPSATAINGSLRPKGADSCLQQECRNVLFDDTSTQTSLRYKTLVNRLLRVFLGFPWTDALWIQKP